jgi:branched-chain amino acid transport system ATP-binding protein
MSILLEARGLTKRYGNFTALDGVSLTVSEGEFVSIIGPNGAGKTTLVNIVTGLAPPTAGQMSFRGLDIVGAGPVTLARRGLARSFQLVNVFPALTVAETLAVAVCARLGRGRRFWSALAADRAVHAEVGEIAAVFGLADRLAMLARTLPQGDKKLLDVASAFALGPELILLDEPTSGVSTADKHVIMDVMVQVEHDMDIVFGYSDRIVALHQGRVLADTTPDGIRRDTEVVATVLGKPRS